MYAVASSAKVVAPTMRMQNSQTKRVVAKVPVKASSFNVEKVRRVVVLWSLFSRTRFTIYARLLSQRREELFSSGDGLEGDDFFFAIIISGARARAEEYAPHRFYGAFNDIKFVSARTAPSERRGGALDASFATRRPKTHFDDVNEKRIIFFFAPRLSRRYLVQRWWMAPKENESVRITHRNILLFLKR